MFRRDNDSPSSSDASLAQEGKQHSIFRERAVKHYLEGREEDVLPQFISPRSFFLLWIVFALLLGGAMAVGYFAHLPLYATGTAVVAKDEDGEHPTMVVFLPPKHLHKLKQGTNKKLLVQLGSEERTSLPLNSVAPKVMKPKEAVERFDLQGAEKKAITKPKAVAMAPIKKLPREIDPSNMPKSMYQTEVEVGSRPAISLAPVVGEWLGKEAADERR